VRREIGIALLYGVAVGLLVGITLEASGLIDRMLRRLLPKEENDEEAAA
jgi:ABC-type nitrate/sulfonate/bicarbonate transport system permease component